MGGRSNTSNVCSVSSVNGVISFWLAAISISDGVLLAVQDSSIGDLVSQSVTESLLISVDNAFERLLKGRYPSTADF